jgi:outer membrane protein assembly factor BamB
MNRSTRRQALLLVEVLLLTLALPAVAAAGTAHSSFGRASHAAASSAPAWPMLGFDAAHTGRCPYAGPQSAPARWKWSVTPSDYFFDASPAIGADGTIYAYGRDALYAICPDGSLRWVSRFAEWGPAASPALAGDGTIYLTTGNGTLYAIDPKTGGEKWHFTGVGYPMAPTVGADGTVYFGTDLAVWGSDTNWDYEYAGYMYAVSPDGSLKWSWKTGRIESTPAVGPGGTVYLTSWDGNLYALDPATGSRKWAFDARGTYGGDITLTSPAVGADGTVYVGNPNSYLYAVNSDGTRKWVVTVGQSDHPPVGASWQLSSPALAADGTVYVTLSVVGDVGTVSGDLHAFNPDGSRKWALAVAGPTQEGPQTTFHAPRPIIDSEGVIYLTVAYPDTAHGTAGGVYAVSPDGSLRWSFTADEGPSGKRFDPLFPVIGADGTLYVGSMSKELYAFGGPATPPVQAPTFTITLRGLKHGVLRFRRSVTVQGTLTPLSAPFLEEPVQATVQFKRRGRWATVLGHYTSYAGAFSMLYKPKMRGAYRVRVLMPKSAEHVAVTSTWNVFRVL